VSAPPAVSARRGNTGRQPTSADIPISLYGTRRGTVTFLTVLCVLFAMFKLTPIAWIAINSTKTQANIFESFGCWFTRPYVFFHNFTLLFQNVDGYGTYFQWFGNTALYAVLGGGGATVLAALAGYGFARFGFRRSRPMFLLVLASLLVPITAITVPLYLSYAKIHLINSIWGMIFPSMVSPVGVYLMRTFVEVSVPRELLDAARVDGAGEGAESSSRSRSAHGARDDDGAAAVDRGGVEQLFPAADHLPQEQPVPAHGRDRALGTARAEQRQHADLPAGRHRRAGDDRAADRIVPAAAAVLAQRPAARQPGKLGARLPVAGFAATVRTGGEDPWPRRVPGRSFTLNERPWLMTWKS
jgi:hypothetical protein